MGHTLIMTNNEAQIIATNAGILMNSKQLKFKAIRLLNEVVLQLKPLQLKAREIFELAKEKDREAEGENELVDFGNEEFKGEMPKIDISLFDDFEREEFMYLEGEEKKERKIDLVNILLLLKEKGILV